MSHPKHKGIQYIKWSQMSTLSIQYYNDVGLFVNMVNLMFLSRFIELIERPDKFFRMKTFGSSLAQLGMLFQFL